jgi:hypothetical protein
MNRTAAEISSRVNESTSSVSCLVGARAFLEFDAHHTPITIAETTHAIAIFNIEVAGESSTNYICYWLRQFHTAPPQRSWSLNAHSIDQLGFYISFAFQLSSLHALWL